MNEHVRGLMGTLALIPSLAGSTLWWLGGRPGGRIYRRLLFPLVFTGLVMTLSLFTGKWSPWFLTSIPTYIIASHVGYGGDQLWIKITRRTLWSMTMTLASLPFAWSTGMWILLFAQAIVTLSISLIVGTTSALDAPLEEGMISFASILFVPFMII